MLYGYGSGVGFGLGGWLAMAGMMLLVIGVIVLIAWLVGRAVAAPQGQGPARPAGQDALELLQLRFARGEITADEYRAAKQVLEDGR